MAFVWLSAALICIENVFSRAVYCVFLPVARLPRPQLEERFSEASLPSRGSREHGSQTSPHEQNTHPEQERSATVHAGKQASHADGRARQGKRGRRRRRLDSSLRRWAGGWRRPPVLAVTSFVLHGCPSWPSVRPDNPAQFVPNGGTRPQGVERLPERHGHRGSRLTKLFPAAQSQRHPDPPTHAAGAEPSATHAAPTQSHCWSGQDTEWVRPAGRRRGRRGAAGAGRAGGQGGTTGGPQEHPSARLPEQWQPLSHSRTNLMVFFINTRVIALQDKPLRGFFTFVIF